MNKEDVGYAPYCPYTEDNKCPSDCYTSDGTLCDFDDCPYIKEGNKNE